MTPDTTVSPWRKTLRAEAKGVPTGRHLALLARLVDAVEAMPMPYVPGNGVHGCPTYDQWKTAMIREARASSRRRLARRLPASKNLGQRSRPAGDVHAI